MPGKEIKGRSPIANYRDGGRTGFTKAGPVGNLPWVRGTSRPGVKKAPRGAEHKEAIKQERIYVKADRDIIPGKKTPVSYTKSRWKNWKKSKTEQYKRKKEYVEAGKKRLQAKYPGFFKSKGGKV